ncbi:MAG: hypothetical protein ISR58_05860 [Anaerolineales bacterium]|nr:hypothetical protein [Chloroflexota bacterium]MBL6980701.1 hypothetical protein [Anaerolineales bacterium]
MDTTFVDGHTNPDLRVVNLVQLCLVTVSILIIFQVLRKGLGIMVAGAIIPLFFWRRFTVVYTGGVEAAILILTSALVFWYVSESRILKDSDPSRVKFLMTGFFHGLMILARFDFVWFLVAFYAIIVARNLFDQVSWIVKLNRLFKSLWAVLPVIAMILPYHALNSWRFGHPLPISAAMISSFPFLSSSPSYWNTHFAYLEYTLITILCVGLLVVFTFSKFSKKSFLQITCRHFRSQRSGLAVAL